MNIAKKSWLYSAFNCAIVAIVLLSSFEKTNAWGEFFSKGLKLPTVQPTDTPKDENVQSIASIAKTQLSQSPQLPSLLASNPVNDKNLIDPIKLSTESSEELPAKLVRSILKSPNGRRQLWQNPRTRDTGAAPKLMKDTTTEDNVAEQHEILKTEYEKLLEKLNQLRESMKSETQNSKNNDAVKANRLDASTNEPNDNEIEKNFESAKRSRRLPSFNEALNRRREMARNFLGPYSRYLDENTRRRVNMKMDDKDDDERYPDREERIKRTTLSTTITTEKPTTTTTTTTTTPTPAPKTSAITRPSSPRTKKDDRVYFPEESESNGNYINKHYLEQHRDNLDKELDETLNRLREKIRKAIKGEEIDEDESANGNGDNNDDENDDLFYPEGADTSCPKNEVYTECGSICEPSCDEPNPDICAKVCITRIIDECLNNERKKKETFDKLLIFFLKNYYYCYRCAS